jgi:glycosyltransferase involved in cell wall biosynthesis
MNIQNEIQFKVSVIIPVYNAEKYLIQSVNSALCLDEVAEIILVEDRSPDNALEICEKLASEHKKVRLYTHPNNENRGAAASRNLGISKALNNYIAFLDADDWYLSNRFKMDNEVFNTFPDADAAYSSSILEENMHNNELRDGAKEDIRKQIGYHINAEEFYKNILLSQKDPFHTNTITFKKSFLNGKKLFDERLRLHQDTEFWYRLIRVGNFYASQVTKPVAIIRRHKDNRVTSRTRKSRLDMYKTFLGNVGIDYLYDFEKAEFFKRIIRLYSGSINNNWKRRYFFYFHLYYWGLFKNKYLKNFLLDKTALINED